MQNVSTGNSLPQNIKGWQHAMLGKIFLFNVFIWKRKISLLSSANHEKNKAPNVNVSTSYSHLINRLTADVKSHGNSIDICANFSVFISLVRSPHPTSICIHTINILLRKLFHLLFTFSRCCCSSIQLSTMLDEPRGKFMLSHSFMPRTCFSFETFSDMKTYSYSARRQVWLFEKLFIFNVQLSIKS